MLCGTPGGKLLHIVSGATRLLVTDVLVYVRVTLVGGASDVRDEILAVLVDGSQTSVSSEDIAPLRHAVPVPDCR